jgi:hypothetical protein
MIGMPIDAHDSASQPIRATDDISADEISAHVDGTHIEGTITESQEHSP